MGEFAAGLRHLKQARTLYNEEHHAGYRHQWGQDIGAAALCYLSLVLWHLGYVDQAAEAATEAMKFAEKLPHPHTLIYTICHVRGLTDLFQRRNEDTKSNAGLVVSICNENGFSHWANCGRILDGWAAIRAGQVDRGIEVLQEGIGGWQKAGAPAVAADVPGTGGRHLRQIGPPWRQRCRQSSGPSTFVRKQVSAGLWPKCCAPRLPYCNRGRATDQEIEAVLLKSLGDCASSTGAFLATAQYHVILHVFGTAKVETRKL